MEALVIIVPAAVEWLQQSSAVRYVGYRKKLRTERQS
jgi:hypothetical protein